MLNLHRVRRAAVVTATAAAALVTLAGTAGATSSVDEIAYGDRGAGVRCVQLALNASTVHAGLQLDGIWGKRTEDAVRQFQRTYSDLHGGKLDVDGIVGHSTGRVMEEVLVHNEHDSAESCWNVLPT